jgi:hypothetical protein
MCFGIACCSVHRIFSCGKRRQNVKTHQTATPTVVLSAYFFFNVTHYFRGEYKLKFSENKVPCKIFGPKKVDVIEHPRILNNEEGCDLYSAPDIFMKVKP